MSDVLYDDYENNFKFNRHGDGKKWNRLYKPIWYNRFSYMDSGRLKTPTEIRHMENAYRTNKDKMTERTKKIIETVLKTEKVDFDKRKYKTPRVQPKEETGGGLTIIPSDPNALLERLDLLLASQDAGHSGVGNELVSICDELKRQGFINTNTYKKLNSIIKK